MTLFDLTGRVAFISGAAGHLGRSMAEALAVAGATVLLNGRNASKLEALTERLTARGLSARACAFDITDEAAVRSFFAGLVRLDVLVNNAYEGKPATGGNATMQDFSNAYTIGVVAAFACIQAALPVLRVAEGASVINIASMYGTISPDPRLYGESGMNNPPFYGAAKAGLLQLTRYLACHLAPDKIRVNAISPGPFPREEVDPAFRARLADKVPLGRIGQPEDLSGAVVFLASSASAYVTGVNLPVDGGWTAW